MSFEQVQQQQTMNVITKQILENITSENRRLPLNCENIPNVQMLISILHQAFPVDQYPRNEAAPITRTLAGRPGRWDTALHFGCPNGMTNECLMGWALLLSGIHPETEEEMTSLKKCCDLFVDTYNESQSDKHLRFLWHLIAQ